MINPSLNTSLRSELAQGHNVGDYDTDPNGNTWRWNGVSWEAQGGGGGGGGGIANIPAFNFDWAAARQRAFDQLTPYYQQKLDLAKGDVEIAKKYIEQDYQNGMRSSQNEYNTAMQSEKASQQQETTQAIGESNNRGTYLGELSAGQTGQNNPSQYYKHFIGEPLSQQQQARSLAIQNALEKQQNALKTNEQQGLETQNQAFTKSQADIQQEQRVKAYNEYAPMEYQQEYTKYKAANNIAS